MYDPISNGWTWIKGPGLLLQSGVYGTLGVPAANNNPGARSWGSISWTDTNGNFWLFGGQGYDGSGGYGNLNDLWKYDPSSNQWTWVSGSNINGQTDIYGSLQQFAAANVPGSRREGTSGWIDNNNNLWLFECGSGPKRK